MLRKAGLVPAALVLGVCVGSRAVQLGCPGLPASSQVAPALLPAAPPAPAVGVRHQRNVRQSHGD